MKGDEYLRPATAEDKALLPKLRGAGNELVEKSCAAIRAGESHAWLPFRVES